MVRAQQIEALANAGEHAQRQDIHFENTQRIDIVLVPFDETALGHCAIADWDRLGQWPLGEDKTADVLRQMARHPNHLLGKLENPPEMRIACV